MKKHSYTTTIFTMELGRIYLLLGLLSLYLILMRENGKLNSMIRTVAFFIVRKFYLDIIFYHSIRFTSISSYQVGFQLKNFLLNSAPSGLTATCSASAGLCATCRAASHTWARSSATSLSRRGAITILYHGSDIGFTKLYLYWQKCSCLENISYVRDIYELSWLPNFWEKKI